MTPEERAARNAATAEAVERLLRLHERNPARRAYPWGVAVLEVDPDVAYSFYGAGDE